MILGIPFWWLLGAGAILSAWWAFAVLKTGINAPLFVQVVQKVLRDKNVSRAIKLTHAAGDIPLAQGVRAAILASVSREEDAKRPAGYRGDRPVPIETVRARVQARYDEAFAQYAAPLGKPFFLALLALPIFAGTVVIAFLEPDKDWPVIGAASAATLFWLYNAWNHYKIVAARRGSFDALWPSFETLYHDRNSIVLNDNPAYPWATPSTERSQSEDEGGQITLDILEPGKPLRTMTFDQSIIKIGKMSNAQVQLSADGVARLHAVIEISHGTTKIIDLGAEPQTRVNEQSIQKQELANGDVIGIGEAELVVRLPSKSNDTQADRGPPQL